MACGHALAIADHRCRHCSPVIIGAPKGAKGIAFYVLIALTALVVALLIINVFLR
jgi:hypothetical protein